MFSQIRILTIFVALNYFLALHLDAQTSVVVQTNVTIRVMAANLNGDTQSYQPFAIRLLQGLTPDVVAIQEFDYTSTNGLGVNTPAAMRELVNAAFGTNFYYFRENYTANGPIPNGIISRYPIIASGSWADTVQTQPNRGFAWAQIAIPGTNNLYVVSVHLLTSTATARANEAANLKTLMQSNFPASSLIVLAGDFNPDSRTESCITDFSGYLSDFPIPVDNLNNSLTSINRNHPHDYVLPSLALTNYMTATVFPSHSFPTGLVFDSRVYTPLSDVPPILEADSGNAQHMAVMKDFQIPYSVTNLVSNPLIPQPALQLQGANIITWQGISNITYTVEATTNLNSTNWVILGTAFSPTTVFAYTNSAPLLPVQFYRVKYP